MDTGGEQAGNRKSLLPLSPPGGMQMIPLNSFVALRGEETMKIFFSDPTNGEYNGESDVEPEDLYLAWKAWRSGKITAFRIFVTIGRYPRSIRVEHMLADRTFEGVIVERFSTMPPPPSGEMAVIAG